jgi:hypothetical protein
VTANHGQAADARRPAPALAGLADPPRRLTGAGLLALSADASGGDLQL